MAHPNPTHPDPAGQHPAGQHPAGQHPVGQHPAHRHSVDDPACAIAHGQAPPDADPGTLVAVFASPVANYLLHFGRDLGFRTVLVEPDLDRVTDAGRLGDHVASTVDPSFADASADIVITDHDRSELGPVLRDTLQTPARWVGVIGSIRHTAPHVAALRDLGVDDEAISRVHRPVGLNIGSRTPAEIAVATLAGLIAERNHRPGGFSFPAPGATRAATREAAAPAGQ